MKFIGRRLLWDGRLDDILLVEAVEVNISIKTDKPDLCYSVRAHNAVAEYIIRTPERNEFSTEIAKKVMMDLAAEKLVNLDDFGLVITDIEYNKYRSRCVTNEWDEEEDRDRPLKVVIVKDEEEDDNEYDDDEYDDDEDEEDEDDEAEAEARELAKRYPGSLVDRIVENCVKEESYIAANALIDEEGNFILEPSEVADSFKQCIIDLRGVAEDITDDISPTLFVLIATVADMKALNGEGKVYLLVQRAAIAMVDILKKMGEEE